MKKYTVFLKDGVAFGVWALGDPLQMILGNQIPTYIEAVLLPYRGKIVYDGIMMGSSIYFGSGLRSSINQEYQKAKSDYGIITTLPFKKPPPKPEDLAEKLAFYMKNAKNRETYHYEINALIEKNPALEGKYHWHWGKINSRNKKKWLKELGLHGLHFAIVNDTIIAQAESAPQIKEMVKAMLPKAKQDWVFYFKVG